MAGAGAAGLNNFGNPFAQSTSTGGQMQIPTFMQPYFGNILGGPIIGQQQNQQQFTQPTQQQTHQPFGRNIYGYNMARLSSMMDPSANLPQYQNPYAAQYQQPMQPNYFGYQMDPFGMLNLGYMMGQPNFFAEQPIFGQPPAPAATPTPAPISDEYLNQIANLQRELASSREEIFNLGKQFEEFGVSKEVPEEIGQPLPKNVTDLYKTILGRDPENADAIRYWQSIFGPTIEPEEIEQFRQAAAPELQQREIDEFSGTPSTGVGTQVIVYGPDGKQYSSPAAARQAGVTNFTYEPPKRGNLTQGANFQTVNNQYGGALGDVRTTVDKNGVVTLVSNSNPSLKTTLPAGSYFDPNKGQIVNSKGEPVSVGSAFLSSGAASTASTGIQFGDTAADIRQEFGKAVNVTDKAKIDSKGTITLEGGTKIPSGSYVDSGGKLRSPDGGLIRLGRKDIPAASPPPPPPPPPSTSSSSAPSSQASVSAPPPPPGSSAGDIAYRNQIVDMYRTELGRTPSESELALIAQTFGSEISPAERQQFNAAAQREKSGGMKKGGIVHNGMTNRLKKMLGN
jgi:hypothetical protein